jgi:hypothetical protein
VSRLEEELDKDAVCHHFYSTYIVNTLPRKLFNNWYGDLVLLAKEETILQRMNDTLIEVGRGYGMEINVEKTKTM